MREEADVIDERVSSFRREFVRCERFAGTLQDIGNAKKGETRFLCIIIIINRTIVIQIVARNVVEHRREFHPALVERIEEIFKCLAVHLDFTVDGESSEEAEIIFVACKSMIRTVDADDVEVVLVFTEHGVESSVDVFALVEFQLDTRIHKVFFMAAAAGNSNRLGTGSGSFSLETSVSCSCQTAGAFDDFLFTIVLLLFKFGEILEIAILRTRQVQDGRRLGGRCVGIIHLALFDQISNFFIIISFFFELFDSFVEIVRDSRFRLDGVADEPVEEAALDGDEEGAVEGADGSGNGGIIEFNIGNNYVISGTVGVDGVEDALKASLEVLNRNSSAV